MVEKILGYLASRQEQHIIPSLIGHNQNCISWRDIFNMLKGLRRSDSVTSISGAPSQFSLAPVEILYVTDIEYNKESENLTLRLCLRYITHPFCVSEFVCRILQQSLAQFLSSHWHDCIKSG